MHGPGSIPQDRNPGPGAFTPCNKAFVVCFVPHLAKIGKKKDDLKWPELSYMIARGRIWLGGQSIQNWPPSILHDRDSTYLYTSTYIL